jgi:hypothetical protein
MADFISQVFSHSLPLAIFNYNKKLSKTWQQTPSLMVTFVKNERLKTLKMIQNLENSKPTTTMIGGKTYFKMRSK